MPTWSISSAARDVAACLPRPRCVSRLSRIWRPIVSTGFRLVIGSWKIIAISLPRIWRSAESERPIRSRPSKSARPRVTLPLRARIPSSASEVTLFPQPDSPTSPSVSPGSIEKETPLTAWTGPRDVRKRTCRSSTASSASATVPQLRVERLAQAVADQVEAEHRDHDRDSREDREERRTLEIAVDLGQHRPPLRRARVLRAEPEEAETGDVDDRGRQRERALHDHRRDRVREDVREEDPAPLYADGTRSQDEIRLALRQNRAAQEAGEDRDVGNPDRDHDLEDALAEHG